MRRLHGESFTLLHASVILRPGSTPNTPPNLVLWAHRIFVTHTPDCNTSGETGVKANKEMWAWCDRNADGLDPKPEARSLFYQFWNQTWHIKRDTLLNFLWALAGVTLIAAFMVPNFYGVAILLCAVGMIDIDLIGSLYLWGLDLNSISLVNLIMAIGLVIDYSAHIAHTYFFGGFRHDLPEGAVDDKVGRGAALVRDVALEEPREGQHAVAREPSPVQQPAGKNRSRIGANAVNMPFRDRQVRRAGKFFLYCFVEAPLS